MEYFLLPLNVVLPSTAVVSVNRLSACSNRATDGTYTVTSFILVSASKPHTMTCDTLCLHHYR